MSRKLKGRQPEMPLTLQSAAPDPVPRRVGFDAGMILAALPDPVLVVGKGDVIQYVNAAAEQFFDISTSALVGTSLAEFLPRRRPVLGRHASGAPRRTKILEMGRPGGAAATRRPCADHPGDAVKR